MKKKIMEQLMKEANSELIEIQDFYKNLMDTLKKHYPRDVYKVLEEIITFKKYSAFFAEQDMYEEAEMGSKSYRGPLGVTTDVEVFVSYDMNKNLFTLYIKFYWSVDKWFTASIQDIWFGDEDGLSNKVEPSSEYMLRN